MATSDPYIDLGWHPYAVQRWRELEGDTPVVTSVIVYAQALADDFLARAVRPPIVVARRNPWRRVLGMRGAKE